MCLPVDLQIAVINKLNGRSVERMRYVSKELKCIIDNFRWCFPRCFLGTVFMRQTVWRQEVALQRNSLTDLGFITFKFLAFTDIRSLILHGYDFTEEFCLWFMNACQESSIAVQRLYLEFCQLTCNAESFGCLIEVLGLQGLAITSPQYSNEFISHQFFSTSAMLKLSLLRLDGESGIDDEFLLKSRCKYLVLGKSRITEDGMRRALLEWIDLKRSINKWELSISIHQRNFTRFIGSFVRSGDGWKLRNKQGAEITLKIQQQNDYLHLSIYWKH